MNDRETLAAMASSTLLFRAMGAVLFSMSALAFGVLGWLITHPRPQDVVPGACLTLIAASLLPISIDMMADMALSRRLARRRARRARGVVAAEA